MKSKQSILIPVIAALIFIIGITSANAGGAGLISSLNLTKDQIGKLSTIIEEFNTKETDIETRLENTFLELKNEFKKQDRLETKSKARKASRNVNKLVKSLSSLHGDMLKVKVEYLLKAKDVFTDNQKGMILTLLMNFDMDMPDNFSSYLDVDLPSLGLDLTNSQLKKLLNYQADMDIKSTKLELKIDHKLLDLQDEILSDERNPQKVNKIILAIIKIGTNLINNQVNYILKAKDVLTLEQKKELLHMMLLTS